MKSRARLTWFLVLAAALLLTLSGGALNTASADVTMEVTRYFERNGEEVDSVPPGQTFDVIITFTAPADNFHGIVLFDAAPDIPADWKVQVDKTWCTPEALTHKIYEDNQAEYTWLGPFDEGTQFTARYRVTVPPDAEVGTPGTFPAGSLLYYVEPHPASAYTEDIVIMAAVQVDVPPVGGTAHPISRLPILALWIALGAAIVGGASLLMRRSRATR